MEEYKELVNELAQQCLEQYKHEYDDAKHLIAGLESMPKERKAEATRIAAMQNIKKLKDNDAAREAQKKEVA